MEIEPPNPNPNPNPSSPPPIEQPNPKRQKMSSTTSDDGDQITDHPTSIPTKPRYKRRSIAILFAYCGVGYQGMQKNPGAKTIEGDLEEALFLSGAVPEEERGLHKRYDWARSARTDKGVSAVGQVVSGKFYVDPPGFVERLQSNLSPQIRIFGFKRATPSFNAKKFCDRRRYVYLLPVFALDPTRHRDRESVMASLGSGSELVKCLECSERGRKVFGVMGKASFESKVGGGVVEVGLGDSSNSESALVEVTIVENGSTKNDDTDSSDVVSGTGMKLGNGVVENEEKEGDKVVGEDADADSKNAISENGIAENEKTVEDNAVGENGNGNGEVEKKSEFCYGDEVKERFNRILKYYEGTHNFHNFTTRTKAEDPAAKRYILSFNANTVVKVDGIEFFKCEVVGQSFMLHQIRKMIGLAVAIMRNYAPESLIETAFEQKFRITVPMAPEVGLYLDECFFPSYNKKWKHTHEELSMKDYAEEAEEFKLKYIYSHIASTEHKDGIVGLWLHSLNYRNYPDLRAVYNVDKSSDLKSNEVKDNETVNASDNVDKSSDLKSNEVKDNDTVIASDNVDNSSDLKGNESVVIGPSSEEKVEDTVNASNNVDNSSDLNGKESVDKGPSSEVKDEDTVNASE